jgi:hypothetical protein
VRDQLEPAERAVGAEVGREQGVHRAGRAEQVLALELRCRPREPLETHGVLAEADHVR